MVASKKYSHSTGSPSDNEPSSTKRSSAAFDSCTSYENLSEDSSQIAVEEKLPMFPGQAAAIIQGMYRRMKAKEFLANLVRQTYEKVYDRENDRYFYYSKIHGTSQWSAPSVLQGQSFDPKEERAVKTIQRLLRKRLAWNKLISIMNSVYEKEYDPDTNAWFYVNKVTKHTMWEKPTLFGTREPPTNTSDLALLDKDREIQELQKELERQKTGAQEAKKALEDMITEERVRKGELDPDEARGRSKHMDEWDINAVVTWFHSIGYKQFDQSIREHRVDGLLLLHFMNGDWGHLGITSPLVVRRIDLAMQTYRLRFERKQRGGADDTSVASDASASDTLSEFLDEEDISDEDDETDLQDEKSDLGDEEGTADDDDLTELHLDEANITKEIIFQGEEKRGRPAVGDVVRIHYNCAVKPQWGGRGHNEREDVQVESSRKSRRRPLEFVVGSGQVVEGIDLGVRTMFYGERAKISLSPSVAYGDQGRPPIIPPGAALSFDVNLLDFWARPRWQKPLVQVLSEPYAETPYAHRSA